MRTVPLPLVLKVSGLKFRERAGDKGLGLGAEGSGFRVQVAGFRVQGVRFRVCLACKRKRRETSEDGALALDREAVVHRKVERPVWVPAAHPPLFRVGVPYKLHAVKTGS